TVLVQYASCFVRIATPAGVGSLALNTRYLIRAGASTAQAVSAVGVSQVAGLVTLVPRLGACAYLSNSDYPGDFSPSFTLLLVGGALSGRAAAVLAVAALARPVVGPLRPRVEGMLSALFERFQRSSCPVVEMGGTALRPVGVLFRLYTST